jgi:hypothetical protein
MLKDHEKKLYPYIKYVYQYIWEKKKEIKKKRKKKQYPFRLSQMKLPSKGNLKG